MKYKYALITGITGMVGSHMLDFLIEHTDWIIYGLYRWRSPLDNIAHQVSRINSFDRIKLFMGDITDIVSLQPLFSAQKFDYVFHLAAQSYPHTSFDSAANTYATNIFGTENILKCVKDYCSDAVVHICSSSEVFGRVPSEYVPINEECRFHPASPYAISKCAADLIGRYYAEAYGINTQITRMFTHTGPRRGDVFMESSFAKQIALIEHGFIPPIVHVGNLDSLRTLADVRDAVQAYFLVVTSDPIPGSYYNIGGTTTMSVNEILKSLIALSTVNCITYFIDPSRLRPIDADLQIPDVKKFIAKTAWRPRYTASQTLNDLLNYWRGKVSSFGNVFIQR